MTLTLWFVQNIIIKVLLKRIDNTFSSNNESAYVYKIDIMSTILNKVAIREFLSNLIRDSLRPLHALVN